MSSPDDPWGDFWSFRLMITPAIIRVIFAIGLIVVPIVCWGYSFDGYNPSWENPTGRFMGGLLLSILLVPLWRVACELAMVAFSMNDRLGRLAEGGMKAVSPIQQREEKSAHSGPTNPNLFPCPECGHYVSMLAKACPKCGQPVVDAGAALRCGRKLSMATITHPSRLDTRKAAKAIRDWLDQKGFETKALEAQGAYTIKARKGSAVRAVLGADRALEVEVRHAGYQTIADVRQGSWKTNIVSNAVWLVATGGMNLAVSGWSVIIQKDLESYIRSLFAELGGVHVVDLADGAAVRQGATGV